MKLSALLAVSLPLLAMSQAPASAEPNAMADTGSWLKASITSLKPDSKPAARKVSHAMPTTNQTASVNLRPFMPGRFLPHEADVQRALVAQRAQMDNSISMDPSGGSQALSGEVNANYMAPRTVASYGQYGMESSPAQTSGQMAAFKKQVGTRSPRLMPGRAPILPEQLASTPAGLQPLIPEPPTRQRAAGNKPSFPVSMPVAMNQQMPAQTQQTPMQLMQMGYPQMPMQTQQMPMQQMQTGYQQMPMQTQQMQTGYQQMPTGYQQMPIGYQQAPMGYQQMPMQMQQMQAPRTYMQSMQPMASPAFEMPRLTNQEQLALERLVAQNRPTAVMDSNGDVYGVTQDNPASGTGPAPSPMSLLPGNAMQSLSQTRHPANVPEARFGSWHGDSSLPECGFHTWLGHRSPQLYNYRVAPPPMRATGKQAASRRQPGRAVPQRSPQISQAQPKAQPLPAARPRQMMVANYPTYTSQRGYAY